MVPIPPTGAHTRGNRLHLSRVHVHGRIRLTSTTLATGSTVGRVKAEVARVG